MIKVNVISKVEVGVISEATMRTLITQEIIKSNPELCIDNIEFERKLNPQRMEAIVSASIGGIVESNSFDSNVTVAEEPVIDVEQEKPKRKKVFE